MTLQSFLQYDGVALRALYVHLETRVHRLAMVFHVAASLERFFAAIFGALKLLRGMVDPLDVVFQVRRRVGGEVTLITLLQLQVLVRQLVLPEQVGGGVPLRALIASEAFWFVLVVQFGEHLIVIFLQLVPVAVSHGVAFQFADFVESSATLFAVESRVFIVSAHMIRQSMFGSHG